MAKKIIGQSWEDYTQIRCMNPSTFQAGCKSMLSLKRAIDGGFREETDAMRLGTGIHALILEPDVFEERFCVMPDFHLDECNQTKNGERSESKATSYVRTQVGLYAELNQGKTFLTRKQYDTALTCIEAIRSRPRMCKMIDNSEHEVTLIGEIEGVPFRGRVDLLNKRELCDIKTTNNVEPHAFGRTFINMRYDFKMAIYRELCRQCTGKDPRVSIIAQETAGDFDNVYYPIPDIVLDNAWNRVIAVICKYKAALSTGKWHGVDGGKSKMNLVVPQWAMEDSGEELDWGDEAPANITQEEIEGAYF